jgi:capsular exopolysaccharide synthesis family protein
LEEEVQALGSASAAEAKTLRAEIASENEALHNLDAEIAHAERSAVNVSAGNGSEETLAGQQKNVERRLQLAGLGGAGCGALLVLTVAWRERRLRRIASSSDVASGLGLPVVGSIPSGRHRVLKVEDLDRQGRISEAVDTLRTVLLNDSVKGPRLVLITSAIDGEGKSTLAVQLAASLARAWRKTLLLDADLRKPEVHTLFQTPLEPGLSEVLRSEAEAAEVIQPTGLSRLWMMPAGHWDAHAIQALAQHGAGRLFDPLKEQFDIIVLDACPVLPVADVLLLGNHVDSVLLAVRSGVSRLPVVQAAQQRLASVGAPLRGAVLLGPDGDLDGRAAVYPCRA